MIGRLSSFVSALCLVLLAAGCAQTQLPARAITSQAEHSTSSGSLLYVLGNSRGRKLLTYTFPGGAPRPNILMPTDAEPYLCSDSSGHLYAPAYGVIFKYAHGGRRPIASLQNKNQVGGQCAADPKTGNFMINNSGGIQGCYAALYAHALGKPTCIKAITFLIAYPTYDNDGNLFFNYGSSGNYLGEVPADTEKVVKIALNQTISNYYDLQWDGQDIAIQTKLPGTLDQPIVIKRVHIFGGKGTVVKTIRFQGWRNQVEYFWISGNLIVAPLNFTTLGIWNYPHGGKSIGSITVPSWLSWTVSVSP